MSLCINFSFFDFIDGNHFGQSLMWVAKQGKGNRKIVCLLACLYVRSFIIMNVYSYVGIWVQGMQRLGWVLADGGEYDVKGCGTCRL